MKFEEALPLLREGKRIRRIGWNSSHYLYLNNFSDTIILQTDIGDEVWHPAHEELLANNWCEATLVMRNNEQRLSEELDKVRASRDEWQRKAQKALGALHRQERLNQMTKERLQEILNSLA